MDGRRGGSDFAPRLGLSNGAIFHLGGFSGRAELDYFRGKSATASRSWRARVVLSSAMHAKRRIS